MDIYCRQTGRILVPQVEPQKIKKDKCFDISTALLNSAPGLKKESSSPRGLLVLIIFTC